MVSLEHHFNRLTLLNKTIFSCILCINSNIFKMKCVLFCLSIVVFGCTTFASAASLRIINGNPAAEKDFPWHVSIIGKTESGSLQLCGGSLIAADWVLTAAHCVIGYIESQIFFNGFSYVLYLSIFNCRMVSMELGFGTNFIREPKISLNVTEYIIHPEYDRSKRHHDLALIPLPKALEESGETIIFYLS